MQPNVRNKWSTQTRENTCFSNKYLDFGSTLTTKVQWEHKEHVASNSVNQALNGSREHKLGL
jgi:hypothetical protein